MKNLKKYFKMIITAVICFAMSLVPGKKANAKAVKVLADGQAVSRNIKRNQASVNNEHVLLPGSKNTAGSTRCRRGIFIRKVFFWLQGPGDSTPPSYESSG